MNKPQNITCEYCSTINPWEAKSCLACGGPITHPFADLTPKVTTATTATKPPKPSTQDLRKAGEKADDVYFTVLNTYAIAWRTLGEAISIAITGFILGMVGGLTGEYFPGIFGATMVGLAVGFTRKQFYFTLISAPAGLLFGFGLGAAVWVFGGDPKVMVFTGLVFAIIGALLGGRRNIPFRQRNCWEKSRPFLGALGGFAFGFLGTVLGWAISSGIQALLQTIKA